MEKTNYIKAVAILFFAFCMAKMPAQTTINITATQDNTLYESQAGNISNGSGQYVFVGTTQTNTKRRAILEFNLDGQIPQNAAIINVALTMTMNKTISSAQTINLHTLTADWGEGSSDAPSNEGTGTTAATNDATWLNTFYPNDLWSAAGGDYTTAASGSASVSGNGEYTWDSGQMATDVQNWLDNPTTNFGWILIGNETTSGTAKRFASREFSTSSSRPALSVTYSLPCNEPGTSDTVEHVICVGDAISIGDSSFTMPGTYSVPLVSVNGCDSLVTLILETTGPGIDVVQTDSMLMAMAGQDNYQWMDCDNNVPLTNETGPNLTAPNGLYAVIVTKNGCIDTTDCYTILNTNTADDLFWAPLKVFPNPAKDILQIEFVNSLDKTTIEIINAQGDVLLKQSGIYDKQTQIGLKNLNAGMYYLRISSSEKTIVRKIIIQNYF